MDLQNSEFQRIISARQSCRKYADKPVEKELLEKCIEAARLAPSACNSQPWHFVVVNNAEISKQVAQATFSDLVRFNKFAVTAPVFVVIVIEKPKTITQVGGMIKNLDYPLYDIGITAIQFCLQAEELGLGTCMMGWFNEKKIKSLLNIPAKKRIGLIISLGYPATDNKRQKIRKSFEEIVSYNQYKR